MSSTQQQQPVATAEQVAEANEINKKYQERAREYGEYQKVLQEKILKLQQLTGQKNENEGVVKVLYLLLL